MRSKLILSITASAAAMLTIRQLNRFGRKARRP
jgi:hypothetical protein